jgi:hypothetical protein
MFIRDYQPRESKYGPFGEVIRASGAASGSNPFRFSTKYQDDETDLTPDPGNK